MSLSAGRVGVRADQVDSFGRVISPSFLNEIMEDLPEWTDLPVRVNGTEQLIPSNPSVPVTSPILTDIDYPDVRRNNQYFTYRESPTAVDGLAKIKSIKGNTLVWNQLVTIGTSDRTVTTNGITATDNRDGSYTLNGTATANANIQMNRVRIVSGHKYLCLIDSNVALTFPPNYSTAKGNKIVTASSSVTNASFSIYISIGSILGNLKVVPMFFDLTLMGLDSITTVEEFTSLFPLPYYAYDSGSLLSFNGTGIKTVGKNLFNGAESYSRDNAGYYIREGQTNDPLPLKLAKGTYTISIKSTVAGLSQLEFYSGGTTSADRFLAPYVSLVVGVKTYTFTIEKQSDYIRLYGSFAGTISDIQIEYGSTATDYEPYTSHTTNLPVATYFPTGMKSAGSVYDELLPTKAITRIGAVDLGTLTWSYEGTNTSGLVRMSSTGIKDLVKKPSSGSVNANILCQLYTTKTVDQTYLKNVGISINTGGTICIYDENYNTTDKISAFKTAMSGVYLYYELATPVELPTLSFE